MARLAHMVRELIVSVFAKRMIPKAAPFTHSSKPLGYLVPDLAIEQFADMYAQTIAYGLFAARCNQFQEDTDFKKRLHPPDAAYLLPKTNPFLRKLFNHIAGPDLDDTLLGWWTAGTTT